MLPIKYKIYVYPFHLKGRKLSWSGNLNKSTPAAAETLCYRSKVNAAILF